MKKAVHKILKHIFKLFYKRLEISSKLQLVCKYLHGFIIQGKTVQGKKHGVKRLVCMDTFLWQANSPLIQHIKTSDFLFRSQTKHTHLLCLHVQSKPWELMVTTKQYTQIIYIYIYMYTYTIYMVLAVLKMFEEQTKKT